MDILDIELDITKLDIKLDKAKSDNKLDNVISSFQLDVCNTFWYPTLHYPTHYPIPVPP